MKFRITVGTKSFTTDKKPMVRDLGQFIREAYGDDSLVFDDVFQSSGAPHDMHYALREWPRFAVDAWKKQKSYAVRVQEVA